MKKGDFQIKKANEKRKVVRSAKINDKDTEIAIEVMLNHNKGLYTIKPLISTSHVEDSDAKKNALCKLVGDLTFEAIKDAEKWREEWLKNRPKEGGSLPMGFED